MSVLSLIIYQLFIRPVAKISSKLNDFTFFKEPYAYQCALEPNIKPNECQSPGLGIEFTRTLCERLNVYCSFVLANVTTLGQINATIPEDVGLMSKIQDGEFDASLPLLSETTQRREVLDFTTPLFYMESGLLVKTQFSFESDFLFAIRPFTAPVWIVLLLSWFTVSFWDAICTTKRWEFRKKVRK